MLCLQAIVLMKQGKPGNVIDFFNCHILHYRHLRQMLGLAHPRFCMSLDLHSELDIKLA